MHLTRFLLLMCCSASVCAQGPSGQTAPRKRLEIARISVEPEIDGILDEAMWSDATRIVDLHQFVPVDHGEPSEASEFLIAYSSSYLYLGAKLYDSDPAHITATQLVQGQTLQVDDQVKFILDTFNNGRTGYQFQVNPNGIRREGIFDSPNNLNKDWTGIWQVRTSRDDLGWYAEIAIPFTTLNFDPASDTWGFTVSRSIARKKEDIAWSSFNRSINPSTTGQISGIHDIDQGKGLDIIPSLVSALRSNYVTGGRAQRFDPSLDVFYKITPNLTGALTLNTDFSATEADSRQVNLSRFSLFFPEKRDFFLQDIDIFSFGGRSATNNNGIPFYSRRIGLSRGGTPVDIDAGLKLTGRVGRWNVGALAVQQADTPTLDGQAVFVGRASANVLTESSVGMIVTHGDPASELANSLAGLDFRYQNTRFSERYTLRGDAFYQQSNTAGKDGADSGLGASLSLTTEGDGLGGNIGYERFGKNFFPALGFANRTSVETYIVGSQWRRYFADHPVWRLMNSAAGYEHVRTLDTGVLQSGTLTLTPLELVTNGEGRIGVSLVRSEEGLEEDFAIRPGIVVPQGEYSWVDYQLNILLSNRRQLAPSFQYGQGAYFGGQRRRYDLGMQWRPGSHFYLNLSYRYQDISLPVGDFKVRQIGADTNYAFNAQWSWINVIQYDNFSNSVGINSRLRWNPRAGEDLYLVLNYNLDSAGAFAGVHRNQSDLAIKYTKNFRF
ncbi:MAG: hypothetical protein RLZZ227_3150 [Pseudomonadota bacterium]